MILSEIIERCFWLLHYNQEENNRVAEGLSWDVLISRAAKTVLDLDVTDKVVRRLGSSPEQVKALAPRTWVELCLVILLGDKGLVEARLPGALDFHRVVSGKAAAHLALLGDNTFRTPWLTTKLLSKDLGTARDAAVALLRHLDTTRPGNRTLFEEHLCETPDLYENFVEFAARDPPVLLWHGHGQFQALFRFLGPRFLT